MDNPTQRPTPAPSREPYEPPAVLEDLPLETYSLTCAKADAQCELEGPLTT